MGWVIYMDEHHLLDGSGDAMCFPVYSGKTILIDRVSCGLAVMVSGEWGSEMCS